MQYGFAYLLWLAVERARTQERLERYSLEHHCERSLKLCERSSIQISLFLLTGGAIMNFMDCGMHWYLTSLLD